MFRLESKILIYRYGQGLSPLYTDKVHILGWPDGFPFKRKFKQPSPGWKICRSTVPYYFQIFCSFWGFYQLKCDCTNLCYFMLKYFVAFELFNVVLLVVRFCVGGLSVVHAGIFSLRRPYTLHNEHTQHLHTYYFTVHTRHHTYTLTSLDFVAASCSFGHLDGLSGVGDDNYWWHCTPFAIF